MSYYNIDNNNRYNNNSNDVPSAEAEEVLCSDAYLNNREKIADVENRTFILCFMDMLAGGDGNMSREDFLADSPVDLKEVPMKKILDDISNARMEVIADYFESVS